MEYALPLAGFGLLVLLAMWSTWRNPYLRVIGPVLLFSFVTSNVAFFYIPFSHRPGIYTVPEFAMLVAALMVWFDCRNRGLIALVVIAICSICSNIAVVIAGPKGLPTWELATNLLFALECLITIGMGAMDRGLFSGGLGSRPRSGGTDPQPDAARIIR